MRKGLHWTDRCSLFENIATDVWNRIIYAHDVKMDLPEIGITADIIVDILHYAKSHPGAFDVYAKSAYDEKMFGNDLDIFVEVEPNQYRWFALQAKILKKNKKYTTFRKPIQWNKLELLERFGGCKAYYLLYNGKKKATYKGKDSCLNTFSEDQFGCSLVELEIVKTLADKKNAKNQFISPSYSDFHPEHAQPWRILTCCKQKNIDSRLYTIQEILESNKKLKLIKLANEKKDSLAKEKFSDLTLKQGEIEITLEDIMEEAGWKPENRFIIPLN